VVGRARIGAHHRRGRRLAVGRGFGGAAAIGLLVHAVLVAAHIRREHERRRFALLPGEVPAADEIDGGVEDRRRHAAPAGRRAASGRSSFGSKP
jgi:hypothetical protein